jgi:hypothetical protein
VGEDAGAEDVSHMGEATDIRVGQDLVVVVEYEAVLQRVGIRENSQEE